MYFLDPGLFLTPLECCSCPSENTSPTRKGSRTCQLVHHSGHCISHLAGAQCLHNRWGLLPHPVLCETLKGSHVCPEAGRHEEVQIRAPSGVKQTQYCMLLPSCVTLGFTSLDLNPPICRTGSHTAMSISKLRHKAAFTPPGTPPELPWACDPLGGAQSGGWPSGGRPPSAGGGPLTGLPSSYLHRLGSNFPSRGARPPQVPLVGLPALRNQLPSPKEGRGRQKEEKPPGKESKEGKAGAHFWSAGLGNGQATGRP